MRKQTIEAFTLAEILVTLGIIGVVAALTIPNLIANYQKEQTVIQLKQVYNMLENAEKMAEVDYGPSATWDYTPNADVLIQKYYEPYLKISEAHDVTYGTGPVLHNLNGDVAWIGIARTLVLANGVVLRTWKNNQYWTIRVDLNGDKGPNIVGKDNFDFELLWMGNKRLVTAYAWLQFASREYVINECKTNTYSGGGPSTCAGIIQYDGWKISDDYPW